MKQKKIQKSLTIVIPLFSFLILLNLTCTLSEANSQWSCTININESSGYHDSILFGEKADANDSIDSYDVPNPPPSPPPTIDAYFYNSSQSSPYNKLSQDWRHYSVDNIGKNWTIRILWQDSQETNITLAWNSSELEQSEYNYITLYDEENNYSINMLKNTNYTIQIAPYAIKELTIIALRDLTPPSTTHDYNGMWYNINFTIHLMATDDLSGVVEIYYKINNGPIQNVSYHGHPCITTEGANNTLEYWSIDKAGNEELPHKILTEIKLDKTAPVIGVPTQTPETNIQPNQSVKVSVNVSDSLSGVKNVTLLYSLDNSENWIESPMTLNYSTGLYEALIPKQNMSMLVKYKITAYDNAGNYKVEDKNGQYYTYTVIPEFPQPLILLLLISLVTTITMAKKRSLRENGS